MCILVDQEVPASAARKRKHKDNATAHRLLALSLDIRRGLREALHFQSIGGFQERRQLLLGHVHLAGIHELEDRLQMTVRDVLQDDDRVLRGVFLQ